MQIACPERVPPEARRELDWKQHGGSSLAFGQVVARWRWTSLQTNRHCQTFFKKVGFKQLTPSCVTLQYTLLGGWLALPLRCRFLGLVVDGFLGGAAALSQKKEER
jgi:hypothetical protein